jgi:hypothetical protein
MAQILPMVQETLRLMKEGPYRCRNCEKPIQTNERVLIGNLPETPDIPEFFCMYVRKGFLLVCGQDHLEIERFGTWVRPTEKEPEPVKKKKGKK